MSKLRPPVNEKDHRLGNAAAPVTLVEYGDYQCPHCGHAHPLIKRLIEEMGDHLQFVYRHFPLQEIHPAAYMAALAAEAAGKQGRFWSMHDLIFEHQDSLHGNMFLDFAYALKLDMHRFGEDWRSKESQEKVESDFESGIRSGVNGTPGLFINGSMLYTYDGSYESLVEAVQVAEDEVSR